MRAIVFPWGDVRTVSVQQLRRKIFVESLGWSLDVSEGREQDEFDGPKAVYAAIEEDGRMLACFRALRTDGRYLAAEVFPQLAVIQSYPRWSDVWEISRFGVLPEAPDGVGQLNYALMLWFARSVGAVSLVALADLAHERLLRHLGIRTRRYGPPQVVGQDREGRDILAVAGEIPLGAQNQDRVHSLVSLTSTMEIEDALDVRRLTRLPA